MSGPRSQPEAPRRVVEETRRLYANLLSKPLDERQLARPTFKLIQDVAKNLITETRLLRKEFNASDFEQASSKSPWDKRRRCDFLQRLIDFAANNKQPVVGCVASKLVAGLEPVKCNELLQALAKVAISRKQGDLKSRTFTKADSKLADQRRSRQSSVGRASATQITSRTSSRNSSATRRASKDERSSGARRDSRQGSNQRAEGLDGAARSSPSSSTTRRQSGRADQSGDIEVGPPSSVHDAEAVKKTNESANKVAGKPALDGALLSSAVMGRNIQLLRSKLRAFQRVLTSVDHLEDQLRSRLGRSAVG